MSLAEELFSGSNKHRYKVSPLYGGRLRVERWFDLSKAKETMAWHKNFGKDVGAEDEDLTIRIFGGFGLLDGARKEDVDALDGAYTQRAYKDCRLVHEDAAPTKEEYQLYQIYETLTTIWEKEDADKPSATDTGLRTMARVQVAKPGTGAPFDEDDIGVETVTYGGDPDAIVVEGAGRSADDGVYIQSGESNGKNKYSNFLPVDGWPDYERIISWITPGWYESAAWTLLSDSGDYDYYTFADTDTPDTATGWDYGVIDGVTDSAVPTFRLATWADIDAAGIDRDTVPILSGSEKELRLAGFQDDSDDRRGRFITEWVEPGILSQSTKSRNNGKLSIVTIEAFAMVPDTPTGYVKIDDNESKVEGVPTRSYSFARGTGVVRFVKRIAEAGILYYDVTYLSSPTETESEATTAVSEYGTPLTISMSEESGHRAWRFSNIDDDAYDGSSLIDSIQAQTDGAIVYVRSAWNQDPQAPQIDGEDAVESDGYYNTSKKTTQIRWQK